MRWFAVQTQPRLELWARTNLWQRGFEVYLPRHARRRRHARRIDTVTVPLFPGYLFVRADMARGDRRRIDSAPGVAGLVAFGERPPAVPDPVIVEIRSREGPDGLVRLDPALGLRPGDPVQVAGDALVDQYGLFDGITESGRVAVLLTLLGRQLRVNVTADRIVRA